MIEHGFYFIKDAYFNEMKDPNLKWNKNEKRPHYYRIQDAETGVYWMIPLSSRIEKYRKIVEKRESTGRRCDTVYITKLGDGRESAFLIQDMIPVTSDYIDREYTLGGIPFRLTSERAIRDIDIRAKRILGLIRNGIQFGTKQPDIKAIMGKLGER